MHGAELYHTADRELSAGVVPFCAMLAALPRLEGSLSPSGQRGEVLDDLPGGDLCDAEEFPCM